MSGVYEISDAIGDGAAVDNEGASAFGVGSCNGGVVHFIGGYAVGLKLLSLMQHSVASQRFEVASVDEEYIDML